MSSILKALRKLKEEKAALGEGGVDISRDILKRSANKQQPPNFWPFLSAFLFFLLIVVGFFFWTKSGTSTDELQTKVEINPAAIVVQPPVKVDLPTKPEVNASERIYVRPAPEKESQTRQPPKATVAPLKVQTPPEALRPNGAPLLKLTGIAYREEATARLAIINDLPVMQGTMIEGAQLVEIRSDRVVLSWQGALFHLLIEEEN
jgi:general secretion pathway protein B